MGLFESFKLKLDLSFKFNKGYIIVIGFWLTRLLYEDGSRKNICKPEIIDDKLLKYSRHSFRQKIEGYIVSKGVKPF